MVKLAVVATLAIGHLNLLSVAFAVLFIGLGIDFGVHLSMGYQEALDRYGSDKPDTRFGVELMDLGDVFAAGEASRVLSVG